MVKGKSDNLDYTLKALSLKRGEGLDVQSLSSDFKYDFPILLIGTDDKERIVISDEDDNSRVLSLISLKRDEFLIIEKNVPFRVDSASSSLLWRLYE